MVPFQPTVTEVSPLITGGITVPRGHWKDDLCACCSYGAFHPSLWNAICFPQILMAQVLTRLKLDMFASPAPEREWRMTFKRILILVVCYWLFRSVFSCPDDDVDVGDDGNVFVIEGDCPGWRRFLVNTVTTAFYLYTLIVMMRTRAAVRAKYEIPNERCGDAEDCCCAFWCSCCTVAQLARQTADYDQQRAVCCSDTGLPPPLTQATLIV